MGTNLPFVVSHCAGCNPFSGVLFIFNSIINLFIFFVKIHLDRSLVL